jgi:hypothetical protein
MAGITRVNITDQVSGRGAKRFKDAKKLWAYANKLYRDIFKEIGCPLDDGDKNLDCSSDEFNAGYDKELGIDTILRTKAGQILTLQEKFLFTPFNTVTVEYMQNPKTQERGDWFDIKCQLYFVGYDYPQTGTRFVSWVLLDWARVVMATQRGDLKWKLRRNKWDGARADFKYTPIKDIPKYCVIRRGGHWKSDRL